MSSTLLCRLEDVPDGGAYVAKIEGDNGTISVIVVRCQTDVRAYLNRCPHFSIGLDFQPGYVPVWRSQVLMCAHHSAMFRLEDGQCIDGPCKGARLDTVDINIDRMTMQVFCDLDQLGKICKSQA